MKNSDKGGSPGSHSHSDQPNWRPADNMDDYLRNCREGLEVYSERHLAKLLGMTRAMVWRAKLMASIPSELTEALIEQEPCASIRELAIIGGWFRGRSVGHETECCPNCGHVLRLRGVSKRTMETVNQWQAKIC